jgi:hypothetical protein
MKKANGYQKFLLVMQTGEVFTKTQLNDLLGNQIHMYRISNYLLDCKLFANAVIKTIKDGRKAVAYQIVNPEVVQAYLKQVGLIGGTNSKVAKLKDLTAEEVTQQVTEQVA